ncbi:unnamed protein product [Sphenostylis stenocarpa]|uniref:Disease resistance protein Roq1-like winged-helix domain-containing protein n=1 Tax=Sphenostylis stenocarpa TaxID=92480 RepID=A0AA86SGP5_9FABA|nr:unnamed protein product [Sphenostylis stenocarpa]
MEITKAIQLHMKHWRDAFCEDADIGGGAVLDLDDSRFAMWLVHKELHLLTALWRDKLRPDKLGKAADKSGDDEDLYSREHNPEFLVESWRMEIANAVDISRCAVRSRYKMLKAYNQIEDLVKHWKFALCDAACIARLVVLHYRRKKDNEINMLVKHAGDALCEAAGISGFVVLNSRNESEAIKKIVNNVTSLLDKTELFVANNPVGVEPRVQEMVQLLDQNQSDDVLLLGVWGMGGIGMDRNDVIHILNGCGLFPENGIRVLVERSLVTVDDKNKLGMHDLLRDMGREVIRSKSPMVLEERSRLWFHEDVLDVLSKETKLRLLQLSGVELVGDFEYLSKDLRWLCWHGFPFAFIPTSFYQGSLISIELENSKITMMWKETQRIGKLMEKLKILNLSHSHYLTKTPDFLNLPNLEKLVLIDCPSLSEVSYTIGHLTKVLLLNFQDCISLRNLPRSIYKLKSLKTLILSGCLKIDKLEEDIEQMESLTTLIADKTAITRVPFSIVRSQSIGYISLCGYEGFSRDVFPSIIWSWMSPANNLSSCVQTFVDMSSLVAIDVPNSSSNQLSYITEELPKLQSLSIECGSDLQLSRDTTSILDALYNSNSEESESSTTTSQMQNNMPTSDDSDCLLPGDCYPDWLSFSSNNNNGSSVTFEIPQVNGRNLKTMMCHIHYSSPDNITSDGLKNLLVINLTKTTIQLYKRNALASFKDEELQRRVLSNIEPGNKVQIVVVFWSRLTVIKTTIYLIYEPIDEKMEHEPAPNNTPNNNVIVPSYESLCAVRLISPEVELVQNLKCVSEKSLTKRLLNKFLPCKYFCKGKMEKKKNQG